MIFAWPVNHLGSEFFVATHMTPGKVYGQWKLKILPEKCRNDNKNSRNKIYYENDGPQLKLLLMKGVTSKVKFSKYVNPSSLWELAECW